jgi:hypothetical protein
LSKDQEIVGRAYKSREIVISNDANLILQTLPNDSYESSYEKIAALPISIKGFSIAIFCLYFSVQSRAKGRSNVSSKTSDIHEQLIKNIWNQFQSTEFKNIFHLKYLHHFENELRLAGEAPLYLKEEIDQFIKKDENLLRKL